MSSVRDIPIEVDPIQCNPEAMSREQRRFYDYFLAELSSGRKAKTENPLDYICIYIDSLSEDFLNDKNLASYLTQIDIIANVYHGTERLDPFLSGRRSNAYLLVGDFQNGWESLRRGHSITVRDVINIRGRCLGKTLSGQDLYKIVKGTRRILTKFGITNLQEVIAVATAYLNDIHVQHQKNFIEQFCDQFDFKNLTDENLRKLSEYYTDPMLYEYLVLQYKHDTERPLEDFDLQRFERLGFQYDGTGNVYHNLSRFNRPLYYRVDIPEPFVPSLIVLAIEFEIGRLFRECENRVREERGLPKVGEGWISETELFRKLQSHFPGEKIVHHAKPKWLSPQHLDIYFSDRQIAIEYQGIQHTKPVDYFGGADAFEAQKTRDQRKNELCAKNNCELIYVYENYSFPELLGELQLLLKAV